MSRSKFLDILNLLYVRVALKTWLRLKMYNKTNELLIETMKIYKSSDTNLEQMRELATLIPIPKWFANRLDEFTDKYDPDYSKSYGQFLVVVGYSPLF